MSSSKKPNDKNSSGEVVNGFRSCRDLSDVVPLLTSRGLFLKPIAKVNISINLPQLKNPGKTISTWEVMEKVRLLIRPDEFVSLKVSKNTLEFIRLDGDLGDKSRSQRVLARLDAQRIKIPGFSSMLKVKAAEAKDEFPSRHSWDSYFRDARHMNELKAGERPDTIHVRGLPIKWFCDEGTVPDENVIHKMFKRWGKIRRIDVPAADPYRPRMKLENNIQKFSFEDGVFFEVFVQYFEYMDFVKAMDAFRGMKLLKKDSKNNLVASLKVDFDKTKHMTDTSVSNREFERKRLIAHDSLVEEKKRRKEEEELKKLESQKKKDEKQSKEKFSRRAQREEKRKRIALTVFRKQEEDKVYLKIAREERKLIKAQRQLESIRLLDELFERIKIKVEKNEIDLNVKPTLHREDGKASSDSENRKKKDSKDKKSKKKKKEKKKKSDDREKSTDTEVIESSKSKKMPLPLAIQTNEPSIPGLINIAEPWYYNPALPLLYPAMRGFRGGRGRFRGARGGRGRPWNDPFQPFNPHYYNDQYYKYFASLTGQDYYDEHDRRDRSHSRSYTPPRMRSQVKSRKRYSRSRSRSRSRRRSRSRSRPRRRSKSRSRSSRSSPRSSSRSSRSRSRKRSHSRSRSTSKRKDKRNRRKRTRSASVKVTRAKSRTTTPTKRKSRSSSWSLPRSPGQRSDSWSKTCENKSQKSAQVKAEANGKQSEKLTHKSEKSRDIVEGSEESSKKVDSKKKCEEEKSK